MAFEFRLESVLKHRQRLEDERQRDYQLAQEATRQAKKVLQDFYDAIDRSQDAIATNLSDGSQSSILIENDLYIEGVRKKIDLQRRKITELLQIEEEAQQRLIDAAKEKKTLEILKEKQREQYKAKIAQQEAFEADDHMIMRRTGRGEGL